jgi:hypothetical protein
MEITVKLPDQGESVTMPLERFLEMNQLARRVAEKSEREREEAMRVATVNAHYGAMQVLRNAIGAQIERMATKRYTPRDRSIVGDALGKIEASVAIVLTPAVSQGLEFRPMTPGEVARR